MEKEWNKKWIRNYIKRENYVKTRFWPFAHDYMECDLCHWGVPKGAIDGTPNIDDFVCELLMVEIPPKGLLIHEDCPFLKLGRPMIQRISKDPRSCGVVYYE